MSFGNWFQHIDSVVKSLEKSMDAEAYADLNEVMDDLAKSYNSTMSLVNTMAQLDENLPNFSAVGRGLLRDEHRVSIAENIAAMRLTLDKLAKMLSARATGASLANLGDVRNPFWLQKLDTVLDPLAFSELGDELEKKEADKQSPWVTAAFVVFGAVYVAIGGPILVAVGVALLLVGMGRALSSLWEGFHSEKSRDDVSVVTSDPVKATSVVDETVTVAPKSKIAPIRLPKPKQVKDSGEGIGFVAADDVSPVSPTLWTPRPSAKRLEPAEGDVLKTDDQLRLRV